MEKFKINANIVLDFMIENHYSEHSLQIVGPNGHLCHIRRTV